VIHSAEGRNVTPSVVDPVKNIVGDVAKRQMVMNPKTTLYSVKRLMGRKLSDESVQRDVKLLPYIVTSGNNDMAVVEVDGKKYTPQEVSAKVLAKLKADAESYLGQPVTQAVITVPAYFDDSQRQATKQAGEIAGLEVLRIINEPTAAALAYGLDKKNAHTIAVYDLGGGTFDITILELGEGVYEVKATNGDTHLGGDDFDQKLVDYLADEFKKEQGVDLRKDPQALQRLRDAAEKAKIELSTSMETEINLPFITQGSAGPLHMVHKLTRAKFESIVDELVQKTIEPVKKCLADSKLSASQIDEVVMVGGMTRMPKIVETVKNFFGKEPNKSVNPDEVVAVGAAVQAGVLAGDVKDVVLLDVTPLTLGVETLGGVMTPLIQRNTTVPTSKSEVFSTAADNQTSVEIHVLQGERSMAADNKSLGRFILSGIPAAPRGVPQVEVTFDIDASGILSVTAKDKASGKVANIKITGSTGLSKEEVEKMKQEAEANAAADQEKKDRIESRNVADSTIYTAEKMLLDNKDKVKPEDKTAVEEKVKALKDILESGSKADLETKTHELSQELQRVSAALPQEQTPPASGTTADAEPTASAAAEEKKDDKKVEEGQVVE
jgi:molecular chaperone DnaK